MYKINVNKSMYNVLKETCETFQTDTVLNYLGQTFTYDELLKKVDKTASFLQSLGVKFGSVVTISLPNIPESIFLLYAVNKLGAICNMVHPLSPFNNTINCMTKTNSEILFILDEVYSHYKTEYDSSNKQVFLCGIFNYMPILKSSIYKFSKRKVLKNLKYSYLITNLNKDYEDVEAMENTLSCYLHSGGTTDLPKTIKLSNFNFNSLAYSAYDIIGKDMTTQTMLSSLPMFHGFGLCMGIHSPLVCGIKVVLIPKFSCNLVTSSYKKTKFNLIAGVPTMFKALLNDKKFRKIKDFSALEIAFCGGDTLPIPLAKDFNAFMRERKSKALILEGYGLTETVTVCAVNTLKNNKLGSVGKAISCAIIKIVDKDNNTLPPMAKGQICVRSDTLMMGYLDGQNSSIVDHYIQTGDLGYIDEDDYLYFLQRIKRVIRINGTGVFPSEIENVASELDFVELCLAVGVKKESKNFIRLFAQLKPNHPENAVDLIKNHCKQNLLYFSVPKEVVLIDKFPLTLVGKIDYNTLIKNYQED